MKIEDAIQQPFFNNQAEKALVNLVQVASMVTYYVENHLKQYGLTLQQYNILRILRGQQENALCLQDIKARMVDKSPDVSRLINRMFQHGYITRNQNPENRRKSMVKISQGGLELLMTIDKTIDATYSPFAQFTEQDLFHFNEQLNALRQNILLLNPTISITVPDI